MTHPPLTILLASPRGFCAGVDRAIQIVEIALERYGPPIYVRHEIVHNQHVVEDLERKGAVFVDELDEVPDAGRVIFSAHGVPKTVPAEAARRQLFYVDATCPLVSKVHNEAMHQFSEVVEPIVFHENERLRLTMVNDTMMAHPIHLHGMFFDLVNGQGGHKPRKHTIVVKPGEKLSVDITAEAVGDWAFHCHLLYHMHAGMFRVVSVRGRGQGIA